jgi:Amt family ammonium transporter
MPAGNLYYSANPSGAPAIMGSVPIEKAVPVAEVPSHVKVKKKEPAEGEAKLSKVSIICRQSKFEELKDALNNIGVKGLTVTSVLGCGTQKGTAEYYRGVPVDITLLPKTKVEVVVSAVPVEQVVAAAKDALYTGHIGDGKIFVYDVEDVVKVRTGESGFDALQDDK